MKKPPEISMIPSDALFQSAFENAAIGMALVAPDGKWLRVNRSVCEITGYSEQELLQSKFQKITHPDDLKEDLANVKRLLAGEVERYEIEKRYLHKNGATVWVLLSVSLVRADGGAPLFFISQIQDITSRKENEQQLQQAATEIAKLRKGLLKICAWTNRVHIDNRWIPVDEFLSEHLHLRLSHGMSVEGARLFKQ